MISVIKNRHLFFRLQDGVKDTIESLREAGIKVIISITIFAPNISLSFLTTPSFSEISKVRGHFAFDRFYDILQFSMWKHFITLS